MKWLSYFFLMMGLLTLTLAFCNSRLHTLKDGQEIPVSIQACAFLLAAIAIDKLSKP